MITNKTLLKNDGPKAFESILQIGHRLQMAKDIEDFVGQIDFI